MKKDGWSHGLEVVGLLLNTITAFATIAVAVFSLQIQQRSSSIANSIASQSVEVAKIGAEIQVQLDKINHERREPNVSMLKATGKETEFLYTLQNTGEKDSVILDLLFEPIDETDLVSASSLVTVPTTMEKTSVTTYIIDLRRLPHANRYDLDVPIIIGPGSVVQVNLRVAPTIPYGVFYARYNDFRQVQLSHSHINRAALE